MKCTTRIYSKTTGHRRGAYFAYAILNFYRSGAIEYCAQIFDRRKPSAHPDKSARQLVQPRGRDKTIAGPARSEDDALAQLQAIADEYGTLPGGAVVASLIYTADPDED